MMKKIKLLTIIISTAAFGLTAGFLQAATPAPASSSDTNEKKPIQILFKNVNIFNGFDDTLAEGMSVLVEANYIKQVGKNITAPDALSC